MTEPEKKPEKDKKPRPFKQTALDADILAALGKLRFATRDVLARAGVGKDEKYRADRLRALEAARLVISSGPIAKTGGGRMAAFYQLTDKGAELASFELWRPITAPRAKAVNESSHAHREGVARTAVALERVAAAHGGSLGSVSFASEVKAGGGFQPLTKLTWAGNTIIPDMLATVTLPDGRARPLGVEFENGANANDPRHALAKRDAYDAALRAGVVEGALSCKAAPRLVMVFATEALLQKVWRAWAKPGEPWPAVYMQAIGALEQNPGAEWYRVGSPPTPLFPSQ